jgi:hypothetical protein
MRGDLEPQGAAVADAAKRPHVTFAPLPPSSFATHPRRARLVDRELRLEESERSPLKPVFAHLRTPYAEPAWNFSTILLIMCVLLLLFIAISWVANRLLLVEIEEQITRPSRASSRA